VHGTESAGPWDPARTLRRTSTSASEVAEEQVLLRGFWHGAHGSKTCRRVTTQT